MLSSKIKFLILYFTFLFVKNNFKKITLKNIVSKSYMIAFFSEDIHIEHIVIFEYGMNCDHIVYTKCVFYFVAYQSSMYLLSVNINLI